MSSRKETYRSQHRERKYSWFHKATLVGTETAKRKDSIQTQFAPEGTAGGKLSHSQIVFHCLHFHNHRTHTCYEN